MTEYYRVVTLVSADFEWEIVHSLFPESNIQISPLGQWFERDLPVRGHSETIVFLHGGWGKIAAGASTQYAIDRWSPSLLVNLGTCGGFAGDIQKGTIILAERTVVYDIIEQMGDYKEHIAHYTTRLDLSWLGDETPQPVLCTVLVSADRDLIAEQVPELKARFGAVAGDWESGAIAWVAARNQTRCLILRGVSDLVGPTGGEAYEGNVSVFREGATRVMTSLVQALPNWLDKALP